MRESQVCLVVSGGVTMENVSADGLAFWVTDLTEVSVAQVHANTINSFQLIGVK